MARAPTGMAIRRNFVAPTSVRSFEDTRKALQQIADLLNRALRSNAQFGLQQHDFSPNSPSYTRVSPGTLGVKCMMPPASADNSGDEIQFNIERANGSFVLFAAPGQLINGATTATFTTNGLVALVSNGVDSWTGGTSASSRRPCFAALETRLIRIASKPAG